MTSASVMSQTDWSDRFSVRASNLKISETRALFAVASRPEVVSCLLYTSDAADE